MTDKQNEMPKEIIAGRSQGYNMWNERGDDCIVLDGEEEYVCKDKYDEVVEQLDLTGQQVTKLAMALDKVMDENERLREVEYMYKEMCELMGET